MGAQAPRFPDSLPPGWQTRLRDEAGQPYFRELTAFLRAEYASGQTVFPPRDRILRALQCVDYDAVNVVVLGQDPYHGPGQAIGLAFAVPDELRVKPPSLANIFREIETDLGTTVDRARSELAGWTGQGVLLLNTVLTVRRGQAFSHRDRGWERFTDRIILLLNDRADPVVFVLWGAASRRKKALVTSPRHRTVESAHPSPLSAGNGFFGSRPFSRVNAILRELGKPPVDWARTG